MARTASKTTQEQRRLVKVNSAYELRQQDIATQVGLGSPKSLRKHFHEQLEEGRIGTDLKVGKALHGMATSGKHPASMIYYLSRKADRRARSMAVAAPKIVVTREQEAA
jgi:hypothetical protein